MTFGGADLSKKEYPDEEFRSETLKAKANPVCLQYCYHQLGSGGPVEQLLDRWAVVQLIAPRCFLHEPGGQ